MIKKFEVIGIRYFGEQFEWNNQIVQNHYHILYIRAGKFKNKKHKPRFKTIHLR